MTSETLLTIFGIIITVIVGYWGIYHAKRTKKKSSLCFIEVDYIPLVKKISKSFDNINIEYSNKPISESLILLRGVSIRGTPYC